MLKTVASNKTMMLHHIKVNINNLHIFLNGLYIDDKVKIIYMYVYGCVGWGSGGICGV
jgi:hypothetical protein